MKSKIINLVRKKKSLLLLFVAAVDCCVITLFNGCKKKDTTPPVITLNGANPMIQSLPLIAGTATWTDPGYSAKDNSGADITSSVVVTYPNDSVKPNLKGNYQVVYNVTDKNGTAALWRLRNVYIVNDAEVFAGLYFSSSDTCVGDSILPTPAIATNDSVDNLVTITDFGGLDKSGSYLMNATISGSTITIPVPQMMKDTVTITKIYSAVIVSAVAPTAIDVKYQWYDGLKYDSCLTHYRR